MTERCLKELSFEQITGKKITDPETAFVAALEFQERMQRQYPSSQVILHRHSDLKIELRFYPNTGNLTPGEYLKITIG